VSGKVRSKIVKAGLCPGWDTICRFEVGIGAGLLCRTGLKSIGVNSITAWLTQASDGAKSGRDKTVSVTSS